MIIYNFFGGVYVLEAFYLIDIERSVKTGFTTYWRSNELGYTNNIREAGLYSKETANRIVGEDVMSMTVSIKKGNLYI